MLLCFCYPLLAQAQLKLLEERAVTQAVSIAKELENKLLDRI